MPTGDENVALVPAPSRLPRSVGEPASVVTTPSVVMRRMVELAVSVTLKVPLLVAVAPRG